MYFTARGDVIASVLRKNGLTISDAALVLKTSEGSIRKLLDSKTVNFSLIRRFADKFDLSLEDVGTPTTKDFGKALSTSIKFDASKFKRLRRSMCMTRRDMSDKVGVCVTTIWKIETGKYIRAETATMIADILGITIEEYV